MDRKNTSIFDKIYFPKKLNYEYTFEYFASKAATDSQLPLRIFNNGGNIERNVEIANYLVTRQLAKTTKKLENKRKEYNNKTKMAQEQWDELKQKELNLRQNFISINQFVKENQEKKERAVVKIAEQNQLKEERQRNMEELVKKCEEISSTKTKMDKNIAYCRIYEEYLLQVIDREDSMQSINDLLNRYEALVGARKDLNDIQQRDIIKLENAKTNMKHQTDDYLTQIAIINNRINHLEARYEIAKQESKKWERLLTSIKNMATDNIVDAVEIRESCRRMYVAICLRKKEKPAHIHNVEKQLLTIKQAIGEYEIINNKIEDIKQKAFKDSAQARVSCCSS
ncbi:coiled-coil domain-containing protein 42 like-2-like [Euwallacea fornicatus]|uniref:coiled-coil domain-containing protein 42 like-2-like n=1 Tax=Euwallacea fornicatus TaxID=995702 RepID=UPI0033905925